MINAPYIQTRAYAGVCGRMTSWTRNKYLDHAIAEYLDYDIPFDFKLPLLEANLGDCHKIKWDDWLDLCCYVNIPWQFFDRQLKKCSEKVGRKFLECLCYNENIPWQFFARYLDKCSPEGFARLCFNTNMPWQFLEHLFKEYMSKMSSLLYPSCNNPNIPWQFFERHLDKYKYPSYDFYTIYMNTDIPWQFFERHLDSPDGDCWWRLCENTSIPWQFFERHLKFFRWSYWVDLTGNTNMPWQFLESILERVDGLSWTRLCENTNIPWQFFERHWDKLNNVDELNPWINVSQWHSLCKNTNIPWQFFERHLDKWGVEESSILGRNTNIPWQFFEHHLVRDGKKGGRDGKKGGRDGKKGGRDWKYPDKVAERLWKGLCENTNIPWQFFEHHFHLLGDGGDGGKWNEVKRFCWHKLCTNTNIPWEFFERHWGKLNLRCIENLCKNTGMTDRFFRFILSEENRDKVCFKSLFGNETFLRYLKAEEVKEAILKHGYFS